MSTLHKVKAYFGMAPMEDYDDEYYDDRAPSRGYARPRFDDDYGRYDGRDYDDARSDSRGDLRGEPADYPPPGYRGGPGGAGGSGGTIFGFAGTPGPS